MVDNEKSSLIVSSFSTLMLEVWEKWDVRGMVLFSLILQIVLSFLGGRRKYKINPFFKTILWFAYLGADWIAIATLGKLPGSYTESSATNVLRAYWAPLLLVHLGGPDTITAYAFEDNKLWIRHLLILVVKAIFIVYIVCLSWTFSWLSFLSLPLILAGILKYVEKILCLKLNNSQKTEPVISNIFNPRGRPHPNKNQTFGCLLKENPNVLSGYLYFTILRPDVNDYIASHNPSDVRTRIKTYIKEATGVDGRHALLFADKYFRPDFGGELFKVFSVELEFMFDVVYTKVALVYTKLGCLLRLTSFASCFSVMLLFFISIINEQKFHLLRIDIAITGILLSGAIALELYAAWVMLSSTWAVLVAELHHNVLVRLMFKAALKRFPHLLSQRKRLLDQMGQFDLLEYCWRCKRKANQLCGILRKITNWSEITEMWHKYRFTKFVNVPPFLKQLTTYKDHIDSIMSNESIKKSRGANALQKWQNFDQLKWSIELDFDHSIMVWHLATSVRYLQEDHRNDVVELSKLVSDYMMYLLAMCPALVLSEHSKSFWLDHTYDKLKELLFFANDLTNAASTLVPDNVHEEELESSEHEEELESSEQEEELESSIEHEEELESSEHKKEPETSEKTFKNLQRDVYKLATLLRQSENKWEMIRDVWMEMLFYAAASSQHVTHVKQLGEGIEFFSFIWLVVTIPMVKNSLKVVGLVKRSLNPGAVSTKRRQKALKPTDVGHTSTILELTHD